jgi:class 3 adenylate cyclase/tetratricopeptide (TPR) repeat protein
LICPNCSTDNLAGAKFCMECAAPLASGCPNCGFVNLPGAKFCSECATPLRSVAPVSAPAAVAERRLVSILFADLVGFTPFAEERDSEDVRDTLNRYFDLAREVIGRYGGNVEKFIGDAVMAVWGAPTAHEDDAERAVRAALDLVDAVPGLGAGIQARAGVLTGEAAVTVGAANQGMVAGDLVNTASRLQGAAAPGSVLVGEATQRAAAAAIAFEPAGEQTLKGKQAPVPAWRALRVVGERRGRNRSDQLEAPFVGRQDDLRLLKELFHATARERRLRVVSVVGPGGIGKSRLSWEFSKYLDGLVEPTYWHRGRSPAYGEGISFWALGEMVRERVGLAEQDDEQTTRVKVHQGVEQWVADPTEREWIERALLTLLGVEGGMAADQLFGAWRTFFERIAERGPVVLVFEDMHFADAGLLDFIDHLLDWSRGVPIYVVTLTRPDLLERRPSWGAAKRNFVSVYLEPLPEADMQALLAGLAPGLPDGAVSAIVARADGIPLYAVETVRMLVADGRLVEENGFYVPRGDLTTLAVPETLTALIAARLDALDEADRRLIHDATVLGQSFTIGGLAALLDRPEAEIEPRLDALVRRELLRRELDPRSPERGQYAFVQALIREVAYNTLSKKDRKALHLAAARYFEALGSDELAGALASHYLAAHANAAEEAEADALAAQARVALRAATARAEALHSYGQAVAFLDQALTVTGAGLEQANLLIQSGIDARIAGQFEDGEGRLRRAVQAAAEAGDLPTKARAMSELARLLNASFKAEEARALLEPALGEFAGTDEESLAHLKLNLARAYGALHQMAEQQPLVEEVLQVAELRGFPEVIAEGLFEKGGVLWTLGRRREAWAVLEGGRRLAEEHDLTDLVLRMMSATGAGLAEADLGAGLDAMRETIDLARRTGRRSFLLSSVSGFGFFAFQSGDWDEALAELDAALAEEMDGHDRLFLLNNWTLMRASRGDSIGDELAEMERLAAGATRGTELVLESRATQSMARGALEQASQEYQELAPSNPNEYLYRAARAELWAGNLDGARSLRERHLATGGYERVPEASRQALAAGIAAAEGRTFDAMALYREALRNWRASRSVWDEALTGIDMAMLLDPADPEVAAVITSTRAILERLHARPYLERLASAVAAGSARRVISEQPAGRAAGAGETVKEVSA